MGIDNWKLRLMSQILSFSFFEEIYLPHSPRQETFENKCNLESETQSDDKYWQICSHPGNYRVSFSW